MVATPNGQYEPDRSDAALARRALAIVQDQSHECIEMLRALLRAARDGEEAVQAEAAWHMRDYGLDPSELEYVAVDLPPADDLVSAGELDERPRRTLAARRAGSGGGRSLLLWAHPDGLPFDGAPDWSVPPFEGVVRAGRIYGWSVADDLSGVAALLMTPRIVRLLNAGLRGDLVLVSAPSKGHASGILAALAAGFTADAGIYLHPAESGAGLGDIDALAPDTQLYRTVERAITDVTGAPPRYYASLPASEIRQPLLSFGLPAVAIGPRAGRLTQAGGVDEWLDVQDYLQMIAVIALTAVRWCKAGPVEMSAP